jgi:CBS domain-containing protein
MTNRTFRVHGPRGIIERAAEAIAERARAHRVRTRTGADQVPVIEIMTRHVVCADPDLGLDALLEVMLQERLGCVPVINEGGQPIGMVTKLDIVEHLAVQPRTPSTLVADVMMPLAITLDDNATVAHAAALMSSEDMHHVMIVSERRLVGIVSTMDITRWLAHNDELRR